jgi:7-cyano-7-deazaguanine synthase
MSKIDVMRLGEELGVPFELTWSCYVSDDEPCGFCVGCTGRARAFEALGIDDPLLKK